MTQRTRTHETAPAFQPINTVFGGGFFPENRMEGEQRNLPALEPRFAEFVKSLQALLFVEDRLTK